MLRVIAACGNGMGSSQIIKTKIDKVFKKLGIDAKIEHNSVGAATSMASNFDVVFVSQNFVDNFKNAANKGTKIIGLKNLLSEKEIEEKIIEAGLVNEDIETLKFTCEVDCANCANKIEEKIKELEEVKNCKINFMTGKAEVEFVGNKEDIKKTIKDIFVKVDSDSIVNI